MTRARTIPYDGAKYFTDAEAQAELLSDALATGDRAYIAQALGTIARARGMTAMAKDVGITREGLYKALSAKGDPKLSTVLDVTRALGLRLRVSRIPARGRPASKLQESSKDGSLFAPGEKKYARGTRRSKERSVAKADAER